MYPATPTGRIVRGEVTVVCGGGISCRKEMGTYHDDNDYAA